MVLVVHHGQRVQLVVPDDVVGNLQAGVHGRHDHVLALAPEEPVLVFVIPIDKQGRRCSVSQPA